MSIHMFVRNRSLSNSLRRFVRFDENNKWNRRFYSMKHESNRNSSVALDFMAHILAPQSQQSFEESREYLIQNPQCVEDFENDIKKNNGMKVLFSDKEYSVLEKIHSDSEGGKPDALSSNYAERTLHFNDSLDFIQTAMNIALDTNQIHLEQPLNMETSNHAIAMTLSLVLHFANNKMATSGLIPPHENVNFAVKNCAVLGAGGCIFPIVLSSALPCDSNVNAIELDRRVIELVLKFFPVKGFVRNLEEHLEGDTDVEGENEQSHKFKLHQGCGMKWIQDVLKAKPKVGLDIIFIDIFDGDSSEYNLSVEGKDSITKSLIAEVEEEDSEQFDRLVPSGKIFNKKNISSLAKSLSKHGLISINTVGDTNTVQAATKWINTTLRKDKDLSNDNFQVGAIQLSNGPNLRDNAIIFVIKNPTIEMSVANFKKYYYIYLGLYEAPCRPKPLIPLPFANKKLEESVMMWIETYNNA